MNELGWKTFIVPVIILIVFIGGIVGIVNWQKSKSTAEPKLSVNLVDNTETKDSEIFIDGTTDKGNKVTINTDEVKVEKDGKFLKSETLKEGSNIFEIKAENKAKKTAVVSRTVIFKPVVATSPTTAPATTQAAPQTGGAVAGGQSNLSTSGPEDLILPVLGIGGIVLAVMFYFKSRKQLATSMKK